MLKKFVLAALAVTLFLASTGCAPKADPGDQTAVEIGYEPTISGAIVYQDVIIFPKPDGPVEIRIDTLGQPLPASKDDGVLPVMLSFATGGAVLNTYGEIKVQGTSTARWPKKNWALSFYADEDRSQSLQLKIGDSIASGKWIAKAEWIDPTILRNGLAYRLWETMVQSRKTFPQYEVDNARVEIDDMATGFLAGAQGFPKSHPALILVNGEHYGVSMLLLGHDPQNYNIDAANPKHIYMGFDARGGYTAVKTWKKFSAEGIGEWIEGYSPNHEDFSEEQRQAIDT